MKYSNVVGGTTSEWNFFFFKFKRDRALALLPPASKR